MFGRTKEINVFDVDNNHSTRISTEIYRDNKNRFITFNSKRYKMLKESILPH